MSKSVIVQISDRRISHLYPDGTVRLRDDTTNKALLYENHAIAAFTGHALLEGQTTDMWVATRLAQHPSSLDEGLYEVQQDLNRLFRRSPYRGVPHSIVVAGWKRNGLDEPTAFSGMVSNVFEPGRGWRSSVSQEFCYFAQFEEAEITRPVLVFAPDMVYKGDQIALYRQLLEVGFRQLSVWHAVRLIADTFRSVADYRPTVGRELMISILPRSAAPRVATAELMVRNYELSPETPSFWTLSTSGDPVQYGPTMILKGVIVSGYEGTFGPGFSGGVIVSRGDDPPTN